MADLYTSLVASKMAINGGQLPPMTPLTEEAMQVVEPEFVPGMGALTEDADKGLRCPVKGCGEWKHNLARHITVSHSDVGSRRVKEVLGIPESAKLASTKYRELKRSEALKRGFGRSDAPRQVRSRQVQKKAAASHRRAANSIGFRNLRNTCPAQMVQRFLSCKDKLGREPSGREVKILASEGFQPAIGLLYAADRLYGSWTNFVSNAGFKARRPGESNCWNRLSEQAVLNALEAWYEEHGKLPTATDVVRPLRTPILPALKTIRRAMGGVSFPEAMQKAAYLLGIKDRRYAA